MASGSSNNIDLISAVSRPRETNSARDKMVSAADSFETRYKQELNKAKPAESATKKTAETEQPASPRQSASSAQQTEQQSAGQSATSKGELDANSRSDKTADKLAQQDENVGQAKSVDMPPNAIDLAALLAQIPAPKQVDSADADSGNSVSALASAFSAAIPGMTELEISTENPKVTDVSVTVDVAGEQQKQALGVASLLQARGINTPARIAAENKESASLLPFTDVLAVTGAEHQQFELGSQQGQAAFNFADNESSNPGELGKSTVQYGGTTISVGSAVQTANQASRSAATNAYIETPVHDARWSDAVAQRVSLMLGKQEQQIEMQLNPPNLGPMEVRLNLGSEQASVIFTSQHAAVREALAAATPKLTALLADQGIVLQNVQVASDSLQQQQQNAFSQQQARQFDSPAGGPRHGTMANTVGNEMGIERRVNLSDLRLPAGSTRVSLFV
ncbi:flagellar hook-length control protein FliK [Chitinibacter sp. GC72]|uniref:flagellar hook-length control protein FliK n=1 Tax=Chitinibacter sp. GC72 TaxID=1526917 RepID=UPI0012FB16A8|nr:flagellar hook-length control protein FliK [Chitinibacter sp. GC72]